MGAAAFQKSEFCDQLKIFLKKVCNHLGCKPEWLTTLGPDEQPGIAQLRTDNAQEHLSKDVAEVCQTAGIQHETIVPHSPHQNGRVERVIATLWEGSEALRRAGGLPPQYWVYCLQSFIHVHNKQRIK